MSAPKFGAWVSTFLEWVRSLIENEHDIDEMEELRRDAKQDGGRAP